MSHRPEMPTDFFLRFLEVILLDFERLQIWDTEKIEKFKRRFQTSYDIQSTQNFVLISKMYRLIGLSLFSDEI